MTRRLRRLVVPAYVLLCLMLGGSVQGIWANMALQLAAIALIAWAALAHRGERPAQASKLLLGLVVLALLLLVVQLIPLPPAVWTELPGRDPIAGGYRILGHALPWLPLSVTPYETLAAALTMLPPLAILAAIIRLRAHEESWLAIALIAGTFLGVLLGAIQVASGGPGRSWSYLFDVTNSGAVGFFANRNHMATLLLVTIPFAVALFASGSPKADSRGRGFAIVAMGAGGFLLVLLGLVLNGSLAGLALALPVIAASAMILPTGWRLRRFAVPAAAVALIAALAALTSSSIHADVFGAGARTSTQSRQAIWHNSGSAIAESFPAGTGIGSFQHVYPRFENPAAVEATYVNHAHNDYVELVLETGLPGLVLLLLFLLWWLRQALRVWQSPLSSHYARAATVASAAILVHSLVDYPLRTAAIAAVFAACLALMAQPSRQRRGEEPSDVRPTKHVTIG